VSDPSLGFVHRWVPGVDNTRLTVLALHGTGADENDLLPLAAYVAPGANVLSPRGRVLEGGAPRFFRRLAQGVFDIEDLVARTHELADFVRAASSVYEFDPSTVVALGYSNGANIAASMLFLRPEVAAGAALLRPMAPFPDGRPDGEPLPDLSSKSVFVGAGEWDPLIPAPLTELLVDQLRDAGADVTVARQAAGHELVQADLEAAARWFGDVVGGRSAG
jgi:phospholipase/carboxylesterase